jgi:SAM-dependent methyltransferase
MTGAWPGEWLWTDYGRFGIEMRRTGMEALEVERASVGFVVCISVMEHVPARVRRAGLAEFARVLEPDGVCVITLDLMRDSDRLWNSALNEQVEPEGEHGSVPDIIAEASDCELKLEHMAACPTRGRRVDVMGLVFRKSAVTQPVNDGGDLSAGRPAAASGDPIRVRLAGRG